MASPFDNRPPGVTRGQLADGSVPIPASAITGLTSWWPSTPPAISSLDFVNERFMVRGGATVDFDEVVTFTRSGVGTYFDADGDIQSAATDVARYLVYDPSDDTNLGLLVEPARTNTQTYSQDFRDTAAAGETRPWVRSLSGGSPTVAIAADGTFADGSARWKLSAAKAGSEIAMLYANIAEPDGPYLFSIKVKGGTYGYLRLNPYRTGRASDAAVFDLSAGTASVGGTNLRRTGAGIIPLGNDEYRCWVSFSDGAESAGAAFTIILSDYLGASDTGMAETWVGDGSEYVWIGNAQIESGTYPSSFIPTTSAQATRGADVATVASMSGYAAAANRSFAAVVAGRTPAVLPAASASYVIRQMDDGTENNRVRLEWYNDAGTGKLRLVVTSGGVAQTAPLVIGNCAVDTDFKVAYSVEDDDILASLDGATAVTDTSATVPSGLTTDRLGRNSGGTEYFGGTIKEITTFRTLSAEQAEALSV